MGEDVLSDALVIHFLPSFLSETFINLPEMRALKQLLNWSNRGLHVRSDQHQRISGLMENLLESQGMERIILLLSIVQELGEADLEHSIASLGFSHRYDDKDNERLNDIFQYVLTHFGREITLEEIADISNLSVNSFCRYFKTKTSKTFSHFLLEVRVGHACKLLLSTGLSISQICLDCGFNNLSNFNRYFKKFVGKTPTQYLKSSVSTSSG
jgi:AraC-like DNA-binding protein